MIYTFKQSPVILFYINQLTDNKGFFKIYYYSFCLSCFFKGVKRRSAQTFLSSATDSPEVPKTTST